MGYYLDFSQISLNQYINILRKADLVPSRRILLEDINSNFAKLEALGLSTLGKVFNALKTKAKLLDTVKDSGLDEDYLTILIREVKSTRPKPNRIKDFPSMSPDVAQRLSDLGIRNTKHFYENCLSAGKRQALAESTQIDIKLVNDITQLSDLSRIKWVNHTFAYMLLETGYESVTDVAGASADRLHEDINRINQEKNFYKGHIGLRDIKRCIESAKLLPQEISW